MEAWTTSVGTAPPMIKRRDASSTLSANLFISGTSAAVQTVSKIYRRRESRKSRKRASLIRTRVEDAE